MRKNCRRDSVRSSVAVYHGVVYDEHLGKVVFSFAHAQQLAFQETEAGEAPARNLERFWFLMDVIGFSFTVVKTNPSSLGASCAIVFRLNSPKAAINTDFFIMIKLLLIYSYVCKYKQNIVNKSYL